ncbi:MULTISPECIES: extracellular solute-binding protein [unclassified Isoptericola]|uniref:extracellular solute-binding protein n=1 Tax=unclassified Isoptericola TaxID=2623355 RepID=UPI00366A53B9
MRTSPSSLATSPLTRRGFLTLAGMGAATVALTSCSSGAAGRPSPRESVALKPPTYVAPPALDGGIVSSVDGMPAIYTQPIEKYFDSVDAAPLAGGAVTTFQVLWGSPPRKAPDNEYWADLNERLGGEFKPTLVAFDTYNEKMATTIASGEVPDLSFVQDQSAVAAKAIDDGVFADLTEVLAGDKILQWPNLANVATNAWTASSKNGHIFGVPNEDPYLTNFPAIRWDAVEATGADEIPSDAAGFLELMTEIAALKSVHGKQLWGIAAFDGKIQSVVQWMFRTGTTWQLDDAGKLVNVIETDAYADALKYHNDLWKAGVYHPDALALATQGNKAAEMFTNGQVAITVDSFNGFFGASILRDTTDTTKGADPRLFVPPAVDGGDLVVERNAGYWGMVAISAKAAEDPKRLTELLNVINYWRAPDGSTEALFINSGKEGFNWEFGKGHAVTDLGDQAANDDRAALQWLGAFKSPSFVVPQTSLDFVDNFKESVEPLVAATVPSPVVGLYNEASISNGARLSEIDTDYRNGIVSGRMPLDAVDEYRDAWRKAGGDAVRDEYQAALDKAS